MAYSNERKSSLSHLVQSTIGLSLVTQERLCERTQRGERDLASSEATMNQKLQFNSKSSAGSVSSDKVARTDSHNGTTNLDSARRAARPLLKDISQDG